MGHRPRIKLSERDARFSLWLPLGLQTLGDLSMLAIAFAIAANRTALAAVGLAPSSNPVADAPHHLAFYIAHAGAIPAPPPGILPGWEEAIIIPVAMLGLLFAISGPPVVLRVVGRIGDGGWTKLVLSLATVALSMIWPVACIPLVT